MTFACGPKKQIFRELVANLFDICIIVFKLTGSVTGPSYFSGEAAISLVSGYLFMLSTGQKGAERGGVAKQLHKWGEKCSHNIEAIKKLAKKLNFFYMFPFEFQKKSQPNRDRRPILVLKNIRKFSHRQLFFCHLAAAVPPPPLQKYPQIICPLKPNKVGQTSFLASHLL